MIIEYRRASIFRAFVPNANRIVFEFGQKQGSKVAVQLMANCSLTHILLRCRLTWPKIKYRQVASRICTQSIINHIQLTCNTLIIVLFSSVSRTHLNSYTLRVGVSVLQISKLSYIATTQIVTNDSHKLSLEFVILSKIMFQLNTSLYSFIQYPKLRLVTFKN